MIEKFFKNILTVIFTKISNYHIILSKAKLSLDPQSHKCRNQHSHRDINRFAFITQIRVAEMKNFFRVIPVILTKLFRVYQIIFVVWTFFETSSVE